MHSKQRYNRYGNINPLSIAYAIRLGLGPTNPGLIIIAQETLLFRRWRFSLHLWLLIPAFSLPHAPARLTPRLQRYEERSSTTGSGDNLRFSPDARRQKPIRLRRTSSLPSFLKRKIFASGTIDSVPSQSTASVLHLSPVTFSAQGLLTSELLRTL